MRRDAMTVNLRQRLRNPPPHFVARQGEETALIEALGRGPVTAVWGLGGIGKTALVLHVLHDAFRQQVPRTLMMGVRPHVTGAELMSELARVVAQATGQ